jgi:hypothetical protein
MKSATQSKSMITPKKVLHEDIVLMAEESSHPKRLPRKHDVTQAKTSTRRQKSDIPQHITTHHKEE